MKLGVLCVLASAAELCGQPPAVSGAVNGASFSAPVAPGSIATLFGTNLAGSRAQASGAPLPATLGDIDAVTIGGRAAPLFFVSGNQINVQIPFEAAPGTVNVTVTRGGQTSAARAVTVAPASPGIFTMGQSAQGAILNAKGALVDRNAPAAAGEIVQVYCTGLGATMPAVGTGAAATVAAPVNLPVTALVGNAPAKVLFAGLAVGFVGLYQVNVEIPSGLPASAAAPLVLTSNGIASNSVTLAVQGSPAAQDTGLAFGPFTVVQDGGHLAAGEPTLHAGRDGTLWVTDLIPAQIWKSTDRGSTWTFVPPPLSFGGSDMDAAQDDAGRVHVLDQSSTNCIYYYRSSDGGQTFELLKTLQGGGVWGAANGRCDSSGVRVDRPWVRTLGADRVYVVTKDSNGTSVNISQDGGQTFAHTTIGREAFTEQQGAAVDPTDGSLYLIGGVLETLDPALGKNPSHEIQVAASPDVHTFSTSTVVSNQKADLAESEFPSIAVDAAHNVYAAWSDNSAGTVDVYIAVSRDRGKSWSAPIRVTQGQTVATYPTIVAGDAGRIAVAWYGTSDPATWRGDAHGTNWYVYAAISTNALDASPTFEQVKVTEQPSHHNSICFHLTMCEGMDFATADPPGYERGLLDFFRMVLDPAGALNLVWADTGAGGPRTHFARQTGGRLLKAGQ
jgi:uncharacterized protein (TIGR03437 family)